MLSDLETSPAIAPAATTCALEPWHCLSVKDKMLLSQLCLLTSSLRCSPPPDIHPCTLRCPNAYLGVLLLSLRTMTKGEPEAVASVALRKISRFVVQLIWSSPTAYKVKIPDLFETLPGRHLFWIVPSTEIAH